MNYLIIMQFFPSLLCVKEKEKERNKKSLSGRVIPQHVKYGTLVWVSILGPPQKKIS